MRKLLALIVYAAPAAMLGGLMVSTVAVIPAATAAPVLALSANSAVPSCPSSSASGQTYVHLRLANCTGGSAADLGRGIRVNSGGRVVLSTIGLARLRLTHRNATPSPLGTFYIKYGAKYLRVSRTGSRLGTTPMLFGMYPGAGWNGPRSILRARPDGQPLASNLGLTAAGRVLHLAPVTLHGPNGAPDLNQVWAFPPTG